VSKDRAVGIFALAVGYCCSEFDIQEPTIAFTIKVNGVDRTADVDGDTPLLWVIRDVFGMTGTKFGCGMALCGACMVHLDGTPTRCRLARLRAGLILSLRRPRSTERPSAASASGRHCRPVNRMNVSQY
jgi:xanthine dehydrogenase iron-sulfur cluster and FAD-binding subunit A